MEQHEKRLSRTELTALANHADLSPEQKQEGFRDQILIQPTEYNQFLQWILLVGGISLLAFGFIFFFAFNWRDITPTWKFTTVLIFLLGFLIPSFLPKVPLLTKQLLVTISSVLVGVLFAVFGQVYQTGAFTYQFIALWLVLIVVWVFVMHFTPLWILFHLLLCTALYDYFNNFFAVYVYLFGVVALTVLWNEWKPNKSFPYWYLLTLLTPAIVFSTARTSVMITNDSFFAKFEWFEFSLFICCEVALFCLAIYKKWLVPIAHISLSLIIVMNAKVITRYDDNLFLPAFLTLGSLVGSVFFLIYLRNSWKNGKA
ncbi:DUF2157 domain-containing protein [Fluviicola taffensis]|uniref:DUF2157 domain-containing protein n=1 Tax=Fluviicola taffensis (strain DSM 16823 / NCIMB 13979 / RW262) TaxID=755732 RepID=F2IGY3_FLUTR|nr:DUF2157 domain-containing protein [Fluviicola taffensis]AEA44764.1 Protein of unknown function DUF2157, membrane [Fluviicola taffensis DSM 16823]